VVSLAIHDPDHPNLEQAQINLEGLRSIKNTTTTKIVAAFLESIEWFTDFIVKFPEEILAES
jgi:hypothetical protein